MHCLIHIGFRYCKYYLFDVLVASVLTDPLTAFDKSFFVTLFDPEEKRFGTGGNETVGIAFGYHGYPDVE